jgi:hypothetical protein
VTFATALNVADFQPVIKAAAKYQTIAKGFVASEFVFVAGALSATASAT